MRGSIAPLTDDQKSKIRGSEELRESLLIGKRKYAEARQGRSFQESEIERLGGIQQRQLREELATEMHASRRATAAAADTAHADSAAAVAAARGDAQGVSRAIQRTADRSNQASQLFFGPRLDELIRQGDITVQRLNDLRDHGDINAAEHARLLEVIHHGLDAVPEAAADRLADNQPLAKINTRATRTWGRLLVRFLGGGGLTAIELTLPPGPHGAERSVVVTDPGVVAAIYAGGPQSAAVQTLMDVRDLPVAMAAQVAAIWIAQGRSLPGDLRRIGETASEDFWSGRFTRGAPPPAAPTRAPPTAARPPAAPTRGRRGRRGHGALKALAVARTVKGRGEGRYRDILSHVGNGNRNRSYINEAKLLGMKLLRAGALKKEQYLNDVKTYGLY